MSEILSMTGFAAVRGETGAGLAFTLTAKSVNHRYLDVQFRMPGGLDGLEASLRASLKERLRRGHVDVTLSLDRSGDGAAMTLNEELLDAAVRVFRAAAERYGVSSEPDLNMMLRMPGVMGVQRSGEGMEGVEAAVMACAGRLVDELTAARAKEGAALAVELGASMERLRRMSAEIGELRGRVRAAQTERLRARLVDLLGGGAVSEDRLLTEAALLVERSDVEEENVRLLTHVERFRAMLDEGGEVGKRMDFLLQELNREANTMLAKTGGAAGEQGLRITELGLTIKVEIERAREQVQNLE